MKLWTLLSLLFCLCGATTTGRRLQQKGRPGYPTTYPSAILFAPNNFNCKSVGRFPFMASIKDGTDSKNHICGGALIAEDAVLTAAHCVDPRTTRNAVIYPEIHLAGADLDSPVQKLKVVAAFPHPEWTGDIRDGNDLVILKLEQKSCTMPLSQLGNTDNITVGNAYQFMGYGRSSDAGAFSSLLQLAPFEFIPKNRCEKENNITLKEGEMCFTGDGDIGVCSGDDGGPLVLPPASLFAFYEELVGIVSYTTGDCGETGAAIFLNVASYKDWIDDTLEASKR